jgi:hypothetical protein
MLQALGMDQRHLPLSNFMISNYIIEIKTRTYMNTISIIEGKICTRKCSCSSRRIHVFEFLRKNRGKAAKKLIP